MLLHQGNEIYMNGMEISLNDSKNVKQHLRGEQQLIKKEKEMYFSSETFFCFSFLNLRTYYSLFFFTKTIYLVWVTISNFEVNKSKQLIGLWLQKKNCHPNLNI